MDQTAIIVVITYLAGVTIAGSLLARRNRSGSDWAVAGGGMSLLMVAVGVAGTRIGGAGTYGVAGNVMSGGVWYMWWYAISTFLAMALVGAFFAVPYRRLELQTVGEIFQKRFGTSRCQAMTSLCVQTEYLIVNVIEAYVIGVIYVGLTNRSMVEGVSIAAFVLVSYVVIGGLWGTAVTNLIHCSVIIVGLLIIGVMGINKLGGWEELATTVNGHLAAGGADEIVWWSFIGASIGPVLGLVFSTAIHTPAASVYTNYASSARSEKIILPAFLLAGVIGATMPMLAGLIGIETLAQYGLETGFSGYRNITNFATEISPILGSVAIAAILAAVISSGGPILLSSATMFVRDWLWFTKDYDDSKKLRAYRIATVIYGIIAAILAWAWREFDPGISLLDILLFGFATVVPPAIAVGYLIYWKGTTEAGAFWGMVIGYGAGVIWYGLIRWALWVEYEVTNPDSTFQRAFHYCFVYDGKGIDPSYLTTLVPLVVVPMISVMTTNETERAAGFYAILAGDKAKD